MQRKPVVVVPDVSGIDLDFRPRTYFWPLDLETHLLARIKGAERKSLLKRLIATHGLDAFPEFLAHSSLNHEERAKLGAIHPAYMGGEYLPHMRQTEVEIARITIASVTQDVASVYAYRGKQRIRYRVVDEYNGETLCGRNTRTSVQPLTLGELEAFFNSAWSIVDVLAMNFAQRGYEAKEMLDFVRGVESAFYPQIGELYRQRIEAWGELQRADRPTMCFR